MGSRSSPSASAGPHLPSAPVRPTTPRVDEESRREREGLHPPVLREVEEGIGAHDDLDPFPSSRLSVHVSPVPVPRGCGVLRSLGAASHPPCVSYGCCAPSLWIPGSCDYRGSVPVGKGGSHPRFTTKFPEGPRPGRSDRMDPLKSRLPTKGTLFPVPLLGRGV